jgi:hypothetical protein
MALIPITARVRPAVSTKDAGGVETAQYAVGTLLSAPSVCYDLLLFTLSLVLVPLVMLFCVALWFCRPITQWFFTPKADRARAG